MARPRLRSLSAPPDAERDTAVVPRSSSDLAAQLRRLGVRGGDMLMVHASLRAVGPVVDGAEGVVLALEEAVGGLGRS